MSFGTQNSLQLITTEIQELTCCHICICTHTVCIHVPIHKCVYAIYMQYKYMYIHVNIHICMHIFLYTYNHSEQVWQNINFMDLYNYIMQVYICMHVCVLYIHIKRVQMWQHVKMYILYTHMHTHIYMHTFFLKHFKVSCIHHYPSS